MDSEPLIVGMGPTGLAAAVFLRHKGLGCRVVEKDQERSPFSKALAVNARSLELLEKCGVTERLLARGYRVQRFHVWKGGRKAVSLDLSRVSTRFPFLLVLPQSATEEILEQRLREFGVEGERGRVVQSVTPGGVVHFGGEEKAPEQETFPLVLAADGAHSQCRQSLGVGFSGDSFDVPFHLADVRVDLPFDPHEAHALFESGGTHLLIRVEDDVWRIIGFSLRKTDLLKVLPPGSRVRETLWESSFTPSHRVVDTFQKGAVFFAGDAAHIHSPVGARGMNLGIEDAAVFASLCAQGKLDAYPKLRRKAVLPVVRRVRRLTLVVQGQVWGAKVARFFLPAVGKIPQLPSRVLGPWVMGLDHELGVEP